MIVTLALRNLAHDKVRLLATLFGVAFSVILMIGQSAIYAGASKTITTMIDQSQADLWIMPVGSQSFEDCLPLLTDSDRQRTTSTNGVKSVTPIVAAFANWMEPSGVIDVTFSWARTRMRADLVLQFRRTTVPNWPEQEALSSIAAI